MTILDRRDVYRPVEYPEMVEWTLKQQQAHWLASEISMAGDIADWSSKLTDTERNVVGNILKGFTQTEVVVNDYWTRRVTKWFPKPEIVALATTIGSFEVIHQQAYAYLNDSLGLDDFTAFLHEPTAKAKIDNLIEVKGNTKADIARSLAIFSGFAEGVQLFSSFAVLMNFSRWNKLKGVGQIVAFSVRDESLHSEVGCWLYRQLLQEFPALKTPTLKEEVIEGARVAMKLEDEFIDQMFAGGEIDGLNPKDLKAYLRYRANTKLHDLDLPSNWKNVDMEAVNRLSWFDYMTAGIEQQDFFSGRVSSYSKGLVSFDNIFEETEVG